VPTLALISANRTSSAAVYVRDLQMI